MPSPEQHDRDPLPHGEDVGATAAESRQACEALVGALADSPLRVLNEKELRQELHDLRDSVLCIVDGDPAAIAACRERLTEIGNRIRSEARAVNAIHQAAAEQFEEGQPVWFEDLGTGKVSVVRKSGKKHTITFALDCGLSKSTVNAAHHARKRLSIGENLSAYEEDVSLCKRINESACALKRKEEQENILSPVIPWESIETLPSVIRFMKAHAHVTADAIVTQAKALLHAGLQCCFGPRQKGTLDEFRKALMKFRPQILHDEISFDDAQQRALVSFATLLVPKIAEETVTALSREIYQRRRH